MTRLAGAQQVLLYERHGQLVGLGTTPFRRARGLRALFGMFVDWTVLACGSIAVLTSAAEESWDRVLRWLSGHAPASYRRLNSPADSAAIAEAEAVMGLPIPGDLKAVLAITDGASEFTDGEFHVRARFLPGGHRLLSVPEIVQQRDMLNQILSDTDEEMIGRWWHPQWLPFAAHIAADALAIDLRPGPRFGAVGEFWHDGITEFDWGPSLAQVIADLGDSIENATIFGDHLRPVVVDGTLDWDVVMPDNEPAQ